MVRHLATMDNHMKALSSNYRWNSRDLLQAVWSAKKNQKSSTQVNNKRYQDLEHDLWLAHHKYRSIIEDIMSTYVTLFVSIDILSGLIDIYFLSFTVSLGTYIYFNTA